MQALCVAAVVNGCVHYLCTEFFSKHSVEEVGAIYMLLYVFNENVRARAVNCHSHSPQLSHRNLRGEALRLTCLFPIVQTHNCGAGSVND